MYSKKKQGFLALILVLALVSTGCGWLEDLKARDSLNKGVRAYTAQTYDEAIDHFQAAIEATEEAIINALVAATTMVGRDGRRVEAIEHGQLKRLLEVQSKSEAF